MQFIFFLINRSSLEILKSITSWTIEETSRYKKHDQVVEVKIFYDDPAHLVYLGMNFCAKMYGIDLSKELKSTS